MKKKLIALLMATAMVMSLAGCSSRDIKVNERTKVFNVTTTEKTQTTNTSTATVTAIPTLAPVNLDELTFSEAPELAEKVKAGDLAPEDITEQMIAENLDTNFLPDPDLLIRTCNEQRISNYLLWQCAYTEFYYTPVAWPDFNKAELIKAIESYGNRNRKFGGLKKDQI